MLTGPPPKFRNSGHRVSILSVLSVRHLVTRGSTAHRTSHPSHRTQTSNRHRRPRLRGRNASTTAGTAPHRHDRRRPDLDLIWRSRPQPGKGQRPRGLTRITGHPCEQPATTPIRRGHAGRGFVRSKYIRDLGDATAIGAVDLIEMDRIAVGKVVVKRAVGDRYSAVLVNDFR
jgi:hypothetical protein